MRTIAPTLTANVETKTHKVAFHYNRDCDYEVLNVVVPAAVPVEKLKFAIGKILENKGYKDLSNLIFVSESVELSAVECGGGEGYECVVGAGY